MGHPKSQPESLTQVLREEKRGPRPLPNTRPAPLPRGQRFSSVSLLFTASQFTPSRAGQCLLSYESGVEISAEKGVWPTGFRASPAHVLKPAGLLNAKATGPAHLPGCGVFDI